MDTLSPVTFKHRHNPDGSWDSVCMKCFLTVMTAASEEKLSTAEQWHVCAELMEFKRSPAAIRDGYRRRLRCGGTV
jgi:hypothetical protein